MTQKKNDLPAMPFYVGDWLKCPEVRSMPPDYRGLWFDLICYMWESTERGVMVKPNGKPYLDHEIVRMVGLDCQNSGEWLSYLLENGVCSRREDGAIFSRRMVRSEQIRAVRAIAGYKGGVCSSKMSSKSQAKVKQIRENENENENEKINNKLIKDNKAKKNFDFELVWSLYPKQVGKKAALGHFNTTVKTDEDYKNIMVAVNKYCDYIKKNQFEARFIKSGDNWFEDWESWVNYIEPKTEAQKEKEEQDDIRKRIFRN